MISHSPNRNTHHLTISMPKERTHNLSLWISNLEWCLIRLSLMIQGRPKTSNTERVHHLTRKVCEITFKVMLISYLTTHRLLFACLCLSLVQKLTNQASAIFQKQEKVAEWYKHAHNDTLRRIIVRMRMVVNINKHQLSHCLLNNHHQKDPLQHKNQSHGQMTT